MSDDYCNEIKTSIIAKIDGAIKEIRQINTEFVLTNDYSLEALTAYRDAVGGCIIDLADVQLTMNKIIGAIDAPPLSGPAQWWLAANIKTLSTFAQRLGSRPRGGLLFLAGRIPELAQSDRNGRFVDSSRLRRRQLSVLDRDAAASRRLRCQPASVVIALDSRSSLQLGLFDGIWAVKTNSQRRVALAVWRAFQRWTASVAPGSPRFARDDDIGSV
jgi:hypothetical protein